MEMSKKNTFRILGIITFAIVLFTASQKLELVGAIISKALEVFAPVIVGISLAFILNIPMRLLETKVFVFLKKSKFKVCNKMLRPISLVTTLILATGFVAALLFIIVPQLIDAIMMLIDKIPTYYENVVVWIEKMVTRFNLDIHTEFLHNPRFDFAKITDFVNKHLPDNSTGEIINNAVSVTSSIVVGVTNFVLGAIIAVYMLAEKEKIMRVLGKIFSKVLPKKKFKHAAHIFSVTNKAFANFVTGQFTDSLVLGILCYIGLKILGIPFAEVVSVIIGIFALIPVIGPIIGEVIGFFIIFMENPESALFFIVYVLILQAIDNNLIYPRIVGKSVGLPGLLVLAAVIVGGNLGGILGVLLGVPVASAAYALLVDWLEENEKKEEAIEITEVTTEEVKE